MPIVYSSAFQFMLHVVIHLPAVNDYGTYGFCTPDFKLAYRKYKLAQEIPGFVKARLETRHGVLVAEKWGNGTINMRYHRNTPWMKEAS